MDELYVCRRSEWRKWLAANHHKSAGVWLVFYKQHANKHSLTYDDAVEEALCYGWVDSIIKKRDDESYVRKLTPRKPSSRWSESNKARVEKLIQQGRMRKSGLAKVEAAKMSGAWEGSDRPSQLVFEMPEEFRDALRNDPQAQAFFEQLAPSYQKQFVGWVAIAKRPETREKRIQESLVLLRRGEKLGMK